MRAFLAGGREVLLVAAALMLFAVLTLAASPRKSAAFDEQYHLTAGYTYLRTGDYRLATTHPPLVGLVAALPLLALPDVVLPLDDPAWADADRFAFSDVFLWQANAASVRMVEWARVPIVLLGLVLLVAIYAWSRTLWGRGGAALALALAATDPNLLANARVVTTDLGVTLFLFLAFWQLWRALEGRGAVAWVLSGVFGGLALGAKYSGGLFILAALLAVLAYPPLPGERWLLRLIKLGGAALIALSVLWALYGFDVGTAALPFWPWPLPAPYYWEQLWRTVFVLVGDYKLSFLLGEAGEGHWWYYFPVALMVKTPLPLLILSNLGLVRLLHGRFAPQRDTLWIVPLLVLLLALTGVLTIGYRHLLPALPFLMVTAGGVATWQLPSKRGRRLVRWAAALLVLLALFDTLRFFPDHEAFFNELAGRWPRWSSLLVDSNLDWGQDLPALAQILDERGIERVNLAYFGKAVPEKYGVRYAPLPGYLRFILGPELDAYNPYTPEPGWYAISATSLRLGLLDPENVDLYAYFRALTPVARAGYSIYLYQVTYPQAMAVARPLVIDTPVAQYSPAALGIGPGTRSQVKWLTSPDAAIYPLGDGFAPPPEMHAAAASFDGVLMLLGYTLHPAALHPGDTLAMTLFWRVGQIPLATPAPTRGNPISAFVHVTAGSPSAIVAQYDGWRTAMRGLEPGDVIAHTLAIDLPDDLLPGEYTLLVGLYSPQSGMRLKVVDTAPSEHVDLGRIEVK